ncbi:MAG: B12-binding domain-containing radical SAM protein [Patescibacteria group bacterium]
MMQRLLFVQLTISSEPNSQQRQELIDQRFSFSYLEPGVAWVAEALHRQAVVKVLNGDLLSDDELIDAIMSFSSSCIGFSSFTAGWPRTERIAERIRLLLSDIPFIFGGWHVSMCGEALRSAILRRYPGSVIVTGRGEGVSHVLLTPGKYAGLVIDGDVVSILPHRYPFNVTIEPAIRPYLTFIGMSHNQRTASIVMRGGCTFSCKYCPSGRGLAPGRSADEIVDEIEGLVKKDVNFIFIRDENPLLYPGLLTEVCEQILNSDLSGKVMFQCFGDVRLVKKHVHLINLMAKAGVIGFNMGVEHVTVEGRARLGRVQSWPQTVEAFQVVREAGIFIIANVMLWCPGDTLEMFPAILKAVQELRPDELVATFFTPFPGFADDRFAGQLRTSDFSEFHFLRPMVVNDPYVTDQELIEAKRRLFCDYYSSSAFSEQMRFRQYQLGQDRFRLLTEVRHERLLNYGVDIMHL